MRLDVTVGRGWRREANLSANFHSAVCSRRRPCRKRWVEESGTARRRRRRRKQMCCAIALATCRSAQIALPRTELNLQQESSNQNLLLRPSPRSSAAASPEKNLSAFHASHTHTYARIHSYTFTRTWTTRPEYPEPSQAREKTARKRHERRELKASTLKKKTLKNARSHSRMVARNAAGRQ